MIKELISGRVHRPNSRFSDSWISVNRLIDEGVFLQGDVVLGENQPDAGEHYLVFYASGDPEAIYDEDSFIFRRVYVVGSYPGSRRNDPTNKGIRHKWCDSKSRFLVSPLARSITDLPEDVQIVMTWLIDEKELIPNPWARGDA